jgi:hypothetical protein
MAYRTLSPRPRPPAPLWLSLPASRAYGGPDACGECQSRSPQPRILCQRTPRPRRWTPPAKGGLPWRGRTHVVNRPEFNVSLAHRLACIGSAERPGIEVAPLYSRFTRPRGHRPEGMTSTLTWPRSSDTCTTCWHRSAHLVRQHLPPGFGLATRGHSNQRRQQAANPALGPPHTENQTCRRVVEVKPAGSPAASTQPSGHGPLTAISPGVTGSITVNSGASNVQVRAVRSPGRSDSQADGPVLSRSAWDANQPKVATVLGPAV